MSSVNGSSGPASQGSSHGSNGSPSPQKREHLSYKFQRLRERIRQAVVGGELSGKLPGERELAKRFKANPKTLSKALTDLAAEGLLERSIGRGTYVKGTMPDDQQHDSAGKWLIVCAAGQEGGAVVEALRRAHGQVDVVSAGVDMRPSFISQFQAVIDLSEGGLSESFLRGLLVRGVPLLSLGREPSPFRVNAVLLDKAHAATRITRELVLAGHRRIVVVEGEGQSHVYSATRLAAARYAGMDGALVSNVTTADAAIAQAVSDRGITAIVCDGADLAAAIRKRLAERALENRVSLAAMGICENNHVPCTGVFALASEVATQVVETLKAGQGLRPAAVYLSGSYCDGGTVRAVREDSTDIRGIVGAHPTSLSA